LGSDLSHYFAPEAYKMAVKGALMLREATGADNEVPFGRATKLLINHDALGLQGVPGWKYEGLAAKTQRGHCGGVLVSVMPGGCQLHSLHCLGDTVSPNGVGIAITQEWITKLVEHEIQAGPINLDPTLTPLRLGALHEKSIFHHNMDGSACLYGSFVGSRSGPKSGVERNICANFWTDRGVEQRHFKPVMKDWRPFRQAALAHIAQDKPIDNSILRICEDSYFDDIIVNLEGDWKKFVHKIDIHHAVNGVPEVPRYEKLNFNTSAGYPWNTRKAKHLLPMENPPPNQPQAKVPAQSVLDKTNELLELYLSGKSGNPIFTTFLKDEALKLAKIEKGDTRTISGAPWHYTLVVRMYFLSISVLMMEQPICFEAMVGIVAQCKSWGLLYRHLTAFGLERIVAGDFKNYDRSMHPRFILAAFRIMIRLAEASGNYDDDDLRVMRCCAEDTAFPLTNFNGDLVRFFGSNPSGHPLTVVVNSLVNALYMRYAYYSAQPGALVLDFKEKVHLATYGDDNIMGICPSIDWFHFGVIKAEMAKINITYTLPDKSTDIIPFMHINDATFLKRSWRYEGAIGDYAAPLELSSIEKSLVVWVRSRSITKEAHMIAIFRSIVDEAFHHGREYFEKLRAQIIECVELYDLGLYMQDEYGAHRPFMTWGELVERWKQNSDF